MAEEAPRMIGHHRVVRRLGGGGMGEVYLAEDTRLERSVALKIVSPRLTAEPLRLRRFEREAKALAAINHPNIVTIYSVERADDVHFLTMELVKGVSLGEHIPADGLPLQRLLKLAIPLCDALAAAHQQGVIHRDLKPANIMVCERGRVKVLDFGLAALQRQTDCEASDGETVEVLTGEGMLMGTAPYMSPEQAEGTTIDHRSDLFSLGIILYEMATGRRPFRGGSPAGMMLSILRDAPPPACDLNHALPAEMGAIIHRCLEKNPDRRYQTAGEVRDDLESLGAGLSWSSSPISSGQVGARLGTGSGRKRWWPAAALGAVAAAVLFLLSLQLRPTAPEPAHRKIVVLPFENLGPPADAYLAAGITEEITNRLVAISGLGVISHTSATQYERAGKTISTIAGDLGVDYVLEGTVRWVGSVEGQVLVSTQLVRVSDDTCLWATRYERVVEDILALQSEIAVEVCRRLNLTLQGGDQDRQAPATDSFEAYHAYLRGLDLSHGLMREDLELAVEMLERAVELDPDLAIAYAKLSTTHSGMYHYRHDVSQARLAMARAAAERALELSPGLPEGHRALAYYYYRGRRDYVSALRELAIVEQALPNDGQLQAEIAYILRRQGRWQESLSRLLTAIDLDPYNSTDLINLGITFRLLRRHEDADRLYDRGISIAPDHLLGYVGKAFNYWMWDGATDRSRAVLEAMPRQDHPYTLLHWYFQEIFERRYQAVLDRFAADAPKLVDDQIWYYPRPLIACHCYLELGQTAQAQVSCKAAREQLERALAEHPEDARIHSALGWAHALVGNRADAVREGEQAVAICPISRDALEGAAFAVDLARIYSRVGETELALDRIEQLLAIPSNLSPGMLRLDPAWDPLRDHPRFQRLAGT